jgi:hypothetical protein
MSILPDTPNASIALSLKRPHLRRLRDIYRSAGWPCKDIIELELLAAGLITELPQVQGCSLLQLTPAGIAQVAQAHQQQQHRLDAHDALVMRVADLMQRDARIVYTRLAVRVSAGAREDDTSKTQWRVAQPDVFSLRNTPVEAYALPIVHEVKVSRADLLSDLRNPQKREAYLSLGSQCFYVLAAGIGDDSDVPADFGVMLAQADRFELLRPAPTTPRTIPYGVWLALAKAQPLPTDELRDAQARL